MLSGQKRNKREYTDTTPATKRSKTNAITVSWPSKHKLSNNQISKLPSLMNPSFHKAVFESFWNRKKFGSPSIQFDESVSKINTKQKTFQCTMTLANKQNKSQKIIVVSSDFDSKKKAQINIYQTFNHTYIPFKVLISKMEPFSFKCHANAVQIVTQKGQFLKSKTKTVIIEPIPLNCSEIDILQLINDKNDNNAKNAINYMEFERDSNREIYKKVFIEFDSEKSANKCVRLFNKKTYKKHVLSVQWTRNRKHFKSLTKKSHYLYCAGFPLHITKNKVLQFLYKHEIEPKNVNLIFKYALVSKVFVQFENIRDCVSANQILNEINYKKTKLFARYSTQSEFDQMIGYNNIYKLNDELIRKSKSVDISNVAWNTNEEELMSVFSKCGTIVKCFINHRKDLFAGKAFIEFESEMCAHKAILRLNGYALKGYALKITMHFKQNREDKKKIKQWYRQKEEQKIKSDKLVRIERAMKKKKKLKRKRLRRAFNRMKRENK